MKRSLYISRKSAMADQGAVTVEFSLVALLFLTLTFGVIEFGRAIFLWNTVQEVTRHAARDATVTDFTDAWAVNQVKQNAIFRTTSGPLILGGGINESYVRISYLNASLNEVDTSLTCPSQNISTCLSDPNGASCIRFVQARLCQPGGTTCSPVSYTPMVTLLAPFFTAVTIPPSQVVMPAESLGYRPSLGGC